MEPRQALDSLAMGDLDHIEAPRRAPTDAAAAAERAWKALDEARPGRVRVVLAGSLIGPAAGAAPDEADLIALDALLEDVTDVPIDLVLQSAGSSFEIAEEVLRRLRDRTSHLAVLVPRRVRGGLSLLACLAEELILSPLGVLHAPLPSLPVHGRVQPADLARLEGPRDPAGAARAGAALDHIRRQLREGLVLRRGLSQEEAAQIAERLTSTSTLGLPGRGLDATALSRLGLPMPAIPKPLQDAFRLVDRALQSSIPPGGHWILAPSGALLRPGRATPPKPQPAPSAAPRSPAAGQVPEIPEVATVAVFEVRCECGTISKIQANLETSSPLQDGHWAYPPDGVFLCPECMDRKDLRPLRRQLEEKTHRKVVT